MAIYMMAEEPLPNTQPSEIRERFSGQLTEQQLAEAFAITSNQFWWVEDNVYDYPEGTPAYKEACEITDAWGELMDYYQSQIFEILSTEGIKIPKTGQIDVLELFMVRNGYLNGQGWWIKAPSSMLEARNELSSEQVQFICEECNITKEALMRMDADELYDVVYDKMCDIEMAEIPSSEDEEESDHCIMASGIVTDLGVGLAMEDGFYLEQCKEQLVENEELE